MDIEKRIKRLLTVICEEIRVNPEFSARIGRAMGCEPVTNEVGNKRKGGRRTRAIIDPVLLASKDDKSLRQQLEVLTVEQLKDILAEYGMDPSKKYMKLKTKPKIIDRIIEVSTSRVEKGDSFR